MSKNYLIIGLGFIGVNLLRELLIRKEKVTVFSRGFGKGLKESFKHQAEFIDGDIRDQGLIQKVVEGQDIIFALAGRSGQVASLKEPFLDLEVNLQGQLNLLEAVKNFNPDAHLIFPGSRLEYGRPLYLPVDENHPLNPVSLYGIHKLTAEKYHLEYHSIFGIKTTVLRMTNPYGPHLQTSNREYNIVNYFIDNARAGHELTVFGDGGQLRDYIYIQDLVELMLKIANQSEAMGKAVNIGSGKGVSFRQMAETVAHRFGVEVKLLNWPKEIKKVETGDFIADIKLLKSLVGEDVKFTDLTDGIAQTKKLLEENNDIFWSKLK